MAREIIVDLVEHDAYDMDVKGHIVRVDQPEKVGGDNTGPTPTDLFVASLAGCVAYYGGRYLRDHDLDPELRVRTSYRMAFSPNRVSRVAISIEAPSITAEHQAAFTEAVSHCTVHNSLHQPPEVEIALDEPGVLAGAIATSGPAVAQNS